VLDRLGPCISIRIEDPKYPIFGTHTDEINLPWYRCVLLIELFISDEHDPCIWYVTPLEKVKKVFEDYPLLAEVIREFIPRISVDKTLRG